ncbi:hypothetical protein OC846_005348 [Tilletia horrida]|uniref:Protein YOP1 n=1 Tax=Tilletia horrida TaxID=155126 RepID=A0AAN6GLH6_9BASI|nr:hypothetical protein OC845_004983 [Tilletia horrida]KAK0546285.1 hypothetical protein OC846_005348 [Tilletia horrida]KAK0562932.1 hypothetical protein OC861_005065 [Tilletia horrida]
MAALLLLFVPLRILSPIVTLAYPLYESYKCITLTPSALRQANIIAELNGEVDNGGANAVPAPSWTSRLTAYGYAWGGTVAGGGVGGDTEGAAAAPGSRLRSGRTSVGSSGGAGTAGVGMPTAGEVAELESWLMYWSILAIIHLIESTVEWVWNWIPLYAHLKILFEFWLVLPQTRGATFLYITYVEPFLDAHENDIDDMIAEGKRKARAAGAAWISKLWAAIRDNIVPSIATANAQAASNARRPSGASSRGAAGRTSAGSAGTTGNDDDEDDDYQGHPQHANSSGTSYRPYWPALRAVNPNLLFDAAMSALNTHESDPDTASHVGGSARS